MDERLMLGDYLKRAPQKRRCLIGWDGVTDELCEVVDVRESTTEYRPLGTLQSLGERILASAGKSCNLELVTKETKLGGNGPIFANALAMLGHEVTYAGTIGEKSAEPVFAQFAKRCKETILLGKSAYTQALEFTDGKVMLGKLAPFSGVTWDALLKAKPLEEWIQLFEATDLVGSVNWTMLLEMDTIWEGLMAYVLSKLSDRKRTLFIDLADPAKRTRLDLQKGLALLTGFSDYFSVVMGLNDSEQTQVAATLGVDDRTERVCERLGVAGVVCHAGHKAQVAMGGELIEYEVPTATRPKVMTGAGDNFNGGFCLGLLEERTPLEALLLGIGTASFYVRKGKSPDRQELAQFLHLWHGGTIT